MRAWSRPRRSVTFDALVAVVLAAGLVWGSVGEAYGHVKGSPVFVHQPGTLPHPSVAAYALVAVAMLVLAWRRRWPVATFTVSLAAVLIYTGLGYVDGSAAVAPMIGLYTVATTGSWRRAVLLGTVTLVSLEALNVAFAPFPALGGSTTVFPFVAAATVCAGLAVANRRAYVAGVVERATLAERTRDDEARRRVDTERLRIARELHDVVAHSIAMINVNPGWPRMSSTTSLDRPRRRWWPSRGPARRLCANCARSSTCCARPTTLTSPCQRRA